MGYICFEDVSDFELSTTLFLALLYRSEDEEIILERIKQLIGELASRGNFVTALERATPLDEPARSDLCCTILQALVQKGKYKLVRENFSALKTDVQTEIKRLVLKNLSSLPPDVEEKVRDIFYLSEPKVLRQKRAA